MADYAKARKEFGAFREAIYGACGQFPMCAANDADDGVSYAESLMGDSLPLTLYKYQPYSERNLRDILCSRLHLSPIDKLNDVNEGQAKHSLVNFEERASEAVSRVGRDSAPMIREFARMINQSLTDDELSSMCDAAIKTLTEDPDVAVCIAKSAYTVGLRCAERFQRLSSAGSLCETPLSVSMWDRYASEHKGFVAAYDFPSLSLRCSCQRENECLAGTSAFLLPVEYRDDRPDLSDILVGRAVIDLLRLCPNSVVRSKIGARASEIGGKTNLDVAFCIHALGHKAMEWSPEREWRLVAQCDSQPPRYVAAKPNALYVGAKMQQDDSLRVVEIAQSLGIDAYIVSPDLESDDYSMHATLIPLPKTQ